MPLTARLRADVFEQHDVFGVRGRVGEQLGGAQRSQEAEVEERADDGGAPEPADEHRHKGEDGAEAGDGDQQGDRHVRDEGACKLNVRTEGEGGGRW